MSYCRFENTYNDLIDCIENMHEEAGNERDERHRVRLLQLMKNTTLYNQKTLKSLFIYQVFHMIIEKHIHICYIMNI